MFSFISMIILYLSFSIILIYRSIRQNNLFNFSNMTMLVFGLIFIVTPLLFKNYNMIKDNEFVFILMLAMITLFFSLLFIQGPRKVCKKYILKSNSYISKFIIYYFIFSILFKFIYLFLGSNIVQIFKRDRSIEILSEQNYYAGINFVGFLFYFITPIILIYCFYLIRNKKRLGYLIYFLLVVNTFLSSAFRTPIIVVILISLMYYNFYIRRVNFFKLIIPIIVVIFILGYGAYMRIGIYDIKLPFDDLLRTSLRGLNTSETFYLMYCKVKNNQLELEYGENLYYYNPISFIPRKLWKDKPVVSFNARMTEKCFGYKVGISPKNWVHTFTVWGEGFMQFHYFGVILYSFLFVYIYRKYYIFLSYFEGSEIIVFQNFLYIPIILRGALDSTLIPIIINIIVFLILKMIIFYNKTKVMDNNTINLISK